MANRKPEGDSFLVSILAVLLFIPGLLQETTAGIWAFCWFLIVVFLTQCIYQPLVKSFGQSRAFAFGIWVIFWMLMGWRVLRISPVWAAGLLIMFPYYFPGRGSKYVFQNTRDFLIRIMWLLLMFVSLVIIKEITFQQDFFEPFIFIPVSFFLLFIWAAVYSKVKADSI